MELDIIKLQTTWNDATGSLNNNFAKIQQAINTGSGGGGADIDTSKFATTAQLQELDNILSDEIDGLKDSKQDVIEDLDFIRSGAALGSTALQVQDASHFATKSDVDSKQNTLVSGTNIKTINGESILGEGNLTIQGGNGSYDDTEIRNELSKKADVDGVYPEMMVGMTRDMLGVGEGDEGEFLFRPTDGDGSIKDGFASIERIEGNSVVWNQIAKTLANADSLPYTEVIYDGDKALISEWRAYNAFVLNAAIKSRIGHSLLVAFSYTNDSATPQIDIEFGGWDRFAFTKSAEDVVKIFTISNAVTTNNINIFPIALQQGVVINHFRVYDLTRMFGAGNEPSTVEEFYQRIPKGIDINAYNEGEVVNMNVEGIKSVGFNLWDGDATIEDNSNTPSYAVTMEESVLRTMKKIMLLSYQGNAIHYTCDVQGQMSGQHIGAMMLYKNGTHVAEILPNLGDICINLFADIEDILNADSCILYGSSLSKWKVSNICIHLVHTGYRNGDYEPYVSDEIALPIADYFPNGMNSIGSVCDELTQKQTIQRIGTVDLGSCDWTYSSLGNFYYSKLEGAVTPESWYIVGNILSAPYTTVIANEIASASATRIDKTIGIAPDGTLYVVNQAYTDVTSFKEAMKGVILYYELAEPIVTSIDKPLALDYQVWDFGTEEAIAEGKTTPLKASIIYEFNARDTIRNNRNMVEELLRRANALSQEIEKKQDIISDLSTIRSGANKGGTSEQTANKTTTLSSSSTDSQYPSAKAVYDALQNVGGGGGSANRPIVKHGNADTIFTLTPNTVHQWEQVASLSLTIPQDDSYELEFFVLVEPNSSDFILTMSSNMQWANGDIPAFEAEKQYEINIRGNRASYNVYYAPSPSGTYISYVENNGSDYILTDIIIDNNIVGLEAKVVPLFDKPSVSSKYYSLMGTRKTSSTADTSIGIYFMSSGVIPYWDGAKKSSIGNIVNGEMLTIDIDYGAIAVNNTNPLAIFGLNTAGSVERIGKFRIYSLAFNDAAGEKVFELKPYKRIDGAYGLFDTISGKFYTSVNNQLTGA